MNKTDKTLHSIGYYSDRYTLEGQQFAKPERRKNDKKPGSGFMPSDPSFIIPMPTNTGTLKTTWHLGGMTSPKRSEFALTQIEWDKKVVCPLEAHIPDKYSGVAIFHFNDGYILRGGPELRN